MGQQLRQRQKRIRRKLYHKRVKERSKRIETTAKK